MFLAIDHIQYFAVSEVLISSLQPEVTIATSGACWLPLNIAIKFFPLFQDCP